MSKVSIGVNTGFAVNRYPIAEDWMNVVANAGVRRVQITADMIDPRSPESFVESEIETILDFGKRGGPQVTSAFTGSLTRLNLFGHPNSEIRDFWFAWYKDFINIAAKLGANSIGGHLSILSINEDQCFETRNARLDHIIKCWVELSNYAYDKGIECMIWEPMSISREFGETIRATREIQEKFEKLSSNSNIKLCLDVDHGDVTSPHPEDLDLYAWIKEFSEVTRCIHIKQSSTNKGGHWPFIAEYNKDGRIEKSEFIYKINKYFKKNIELFLELSFRERNPVDLKAPEYIKKSVEYWLSEDVVT